MWFQGGNLFTGGASFAPGVISSPLPTATLPTSVYTGVTGTIGQIIGAIKGIPSPGTIPGSVTSPNQVPGYGSGLGFLLLLALVVILIVAFTKKG